MKTSKPIDVDSFIADFRPGILGFTVFVYMV